MKAPLSKNGFYCNSKVPIVAVKINDSLNESIGSLNDSFVFLDSDTVNALNNTNHSIDATVVNDVMNDIQNTSANIVNVDNIVNVSASIVLPSDLSAEKNDLIGREIKLIIVKMMAP